jgi:hypothetical protein
MTIGPVMRACTDEALDDIIYLQIVEGIAGRKKRPLSIPENDKTPMKSRPGTPVKRYELHSRCHAAVI